MNKATGCGLIALMVLAAPAPAATPSTQPNCKKESCTVFVIVNGNTCGGGIAMTPDPLITKVGTEVTITWKLLGGAWEFDPVKGVVVRDGAKVFKDTGKGKDTWTTINPADKPQVWSYDINLVKKDNPKETCSRDPTIINQ